MRGAACRCADPTLDAWGKALHVTGAIVCVCLFALGFIMVKIPMEYSAQYKASMWLSWVAQGFAIMILCLVALVDTAVRTFWVKKNFGFLTSIIGRGSFYVLMGMYSVPQVSMLQDLSKMEDHEATSTAAAFALIGVIASFGVGVCHCVYYCRSGSDRFADESEGLANPSPAAATAAAVPQGGAPTAFGQPSGRV